MADEATLVTLEPGGPADAARQLAVGAHWGDDLTPSQYAAREAHVWQHAAWVERDRACTVFALALQGEPPAAAPAVSCEVFAMELLHVASPGVVARGKALGIASVFTLAQHRRRSLASRMLRALAASPQAAHAHALLLMSEVEPALYERCAYVAPSKAIHDWVFSATAAAPAAAPAAALVAAAELPALAARLAALVERDLLACGQVGAVAVAPSAEQLLWHAARFAGRRAALGLEPLSLPCGAKCGDAFAIWALDAEDGATVLRVLALVASDDAEATSAVISAAVRSAESAGAPAGRTLAWTTGTLHAGAAAQQPWTPPAEQLAAAGVAVAREARRCLSVPWTPPTAQLAAAGVAVAKEDRRCLSVPMMAALRPHLQPASWTWIPRGVWV